jgi:exo beta-1,2-glucooligosaccharide sophorohydrolase (non-reducing end)
MRISEPFWRWFFGILLTWSTAASGNTEYYRHVIFDNSLTSDAYFYSSAIGNGASFVEQSNSRLPVEAKTFLTLPNALRINWRSEKGGGWDAEVRVMNYRNRFLEFLGHKLYFWCFATEPIAAADLPSIVLSTSREGLQVAVNYRTGLVWKNFTSNPEITDMLRELDRLTATASQ